MGKTIVNRADWLKLGVKKFSKGGVNSLNIEKMAKEVGVSKTSFYWHFRSKDNYVNELIEYWFDTTVKPIAEQTGEGSSAEERFRTFIELTLRDLSGMDFLFHLRKMGATKPDLHLLMEKLNAQRLMYIAYLIGELGYEEESASKRAEILFQFFQGWHVMNDHKTDNNEEDINHAVQLIRDFVAF